jgi:hypothetical protein
MNLGKENCCKGSEKAAIKTLIELSQTENNAESYNCDKSMQGWTSSDSLNKKQTKHSATQRPVSALGKPPISKLQYKSLNQKSENSKTETKSLLESKSFNQKPEKSKTDHKSLLIRITSPTPPESNALLHFIKPPIPIIIYPRSKSVKDEQTRRKSIDYVHITKEINFTFRRKMRKYKIIRYPSIESKNEGLNLITMPRPFEN